MSEAATKVPVTENSATAPLVPEPKESETIAPVVSEEKKEGEQPVTHRDWWPFETLRREVERVFEDFYRGPWRLPFTRTAFDVAPVWPGETIWRTIPVADVIERDQAYVITAELPGVPAGNVGVNFSEGRLTITGEKKEEKEEDRKGVHVSERRYGCFQRTFRVPEDVDAEKIDASFRDGVLSVILPRIPAAGKSDRKIDVKAA